MTTTESPRARPQASGAGSGPGGPGLLGRLRDVSIGPFGGTVAVVLVGAGLLVIGIGWNGAAGSGEEINGVPDIRAQIPWLISGGALGLALVILGAALMVTQSHRTDRALLEAKLDELSAAWRASSAGSSVAPVNLAGLVAAGASSYHRPECRLVQGREGVEYLTPTEASSRSLRPCRICEPPSA